ncbi:MAG: hypothetical protein LT067_06455 [Sulfurovum sp.]|nr:hypothetical protein [Sulfurovum sp.]
MIKIYVDEQRTRTKYRVRVMSGNVVLAAFYANDMDEAQRLKSFARKVINGTRGDFI